MNKIKLVKNIADIFSIKTGAIKKLDSKCYKVKRWIEVGFKIYYSLPVYFAVMFLFLLQPHWFNNIIMRFVETIVLYIVLEYLLVLVMPVEEVPCWKKNLQDHDNL